MSRSFRRFEMLLPQSFNDGQAVPATAFEETLQELKDRFSGVSTETQDIQGYSVHQGQPFTDDLLRIYVDVPDTPDNWQFFKDFKTRLMNRFGQVDIWIATYPVEVL